MSHDEISECLSGPWQAVLSLSRLGRGPLAVPMSYVYTGDEFRMITSAQSQHGKLMRANGRATMTVHHDHNSGRSVKQWYVIAEGPITFTDDNPEPTLRAIMAKDRGAGLADEWVEQSLPNATDVAVLVPDRIAGYRGESELS
jgi:nitroimidazol reductase NimA-like FMN-containing flavoprotein (pyridoxamine 5'-phosphate oxidase superfamily)